jgi:hypothetical protein
MTLIIMSDYEFEEKLVYALRHNSEVRKELFKALMHELEYGLDKDELVKLLSEEFAKRLTRRSY